MLEPGKIDEIIKNFLASLPEGLQHLPQDVQAGLKTCLQDSLRKMELITREEFDIQTQVLQAARTKLDQLEKLVNAMKD